MGSGSSTETTSGGIGTLGLLGVVFVTLKLCGVIDWSWWWVTVPFWGPLALLATILVAIGIFLFGCWLVAWVNETT